MAAYLFVWIMRKSVNVCGGIFLCVEASSSITFHLVLFIETGSDYTDQSGLELVDLAILAG